MDSHLGILGFVMSVLSSSHLDINPTHHHIGHRSHVGNVNHLSVTLKATRSIWSFKEGNGMSLILIPSRLAIQYQMLQATISRLYI